VTGATSLRNNTFVENVASEDGGGLAVTDAQLSVAFNSFLGNAAVEGGGAWVQDSTLGFANNLVAWTAAGDGLVVGWSGSAPTLEFDYGAWYDNTTTDVSGAASAAWLGANSLFVEPGLESYTPGATDCHAAGWWLGLDSPLIDAGDPSIEDLDGGVADIGSWGGPDADPDDWADADDDGFPALWDCDDTDDGAYPGNEEVPYDGSDNDCQDGDLTDVDGDGYDGEEVEGGDDCDDDEPTTYPGADEVLDDGIDQDCDGKDAAYGDGTVRTWAWEDTGVTPSGDGCACASASPVGAWGLLGLLLGVGRRRRR